MSFFERLSEICNEKGIAVSNLGDYVAVDDRPIGKSTISGWRSGAKPRNKAVKAIADFFLVDFYWLRDGVVPVDEPVRIEPPSTRDCASCPCLEHCPKALSPMEMELINVFRSATENEKMRIIYEIMKVLGQ